jgi:uncharacterized protein involved in outer membrane biogenesis
MATRILSAGWRFWRWPAGIAAALAIIAAAVPFLVPAAHFIPQVTRIASEKLNQPVSLGDLRLHLFPTPRVVAQGLQVGMKGEVAVEELEIVPELLPLLSGRLAISVVVARGVSMKQAALAIPGGLPKSQGGGEAVNIRRVRLEKVSLQHPAAKLPLFDVDLRFGDAFALETAQIEARDIDLKVAMVPEAQKVAAYTYEGRIYGGTVKGTARLDTSKQVSLSGKAAMAGVELLPVQTLLGKPAQFSGRLKTDVSFSARARSADKLAEVLSLDAPFEITGGTYHGYDLSKVGGLSGKLEKGGATKFDELRGTVQLRAKQVKVMPLCVKSPSLTAAGNVDISPSQELSGKLDVSVAKTGGFVGIPVQLRGTTSDPWFTPTKGYLIGAAVGTAVLPIIGTSIGSSLGSRMEGKVDCN